MKNNYLGENIVKNILILIFALILYPTILQETNNLVGNQIGDFLLLLSILLVAVCFANFAYTYEKCKIEVLGHRLLAHVTTFIFMLLLAAMLLTMVSTVKVVFIAVFPIVTTFAILLYLGIVLYDFWDLLRADK